MKRLTADEIVIGGGVGFLAGALLSLTLFGCSAAQIEDGASKVAVACQIAMPLASSALALPMAGPFIAAGVVMGCATDAGIARLAADPSSAQWLDQQATMLKDAL